MSLEGVREMATESIFAVAHVVMDAWVKASIDVLLTAVFISFAFFNSEVLVGAKVLDHLEFAFKLFILEEFFVVHFLLIK